MINKNWILIKSLRMIILFNHNKKLLKKYASMRFVIIQIVINAEEHQHFSHRQISSVLTDLFIKKTCHF